MTLERTADQFLLPDIAAPWPRGSDTSRLQALVDLVAHEVQVAPEIVFSAALGALSTACQAGYVVRIPERELTHPVSVMLLSVANSGERKTAIDNVIFESVRDYQKEQEIKNQSLLEKYEHEMDIWKHMKNALISVLKKAVKEDDEQATANARNKIDALEEKKPIPPKTINLIYEDTTPQALIRAMHDNAPLACVVSSEADHILNGFAMGNNAPLNSLWSGSDITVSRSTRESFTLSGGRLTMALMTQESSVDHYMEKRGKRARGSGLLARFLPVYVKSLIGQREYKPGNMKASRYLKDFHFRINTLLHETIKENDSNPPSPTIIEFTPEAAQQWIKATNAIEQQCQFDGIYENARDHASKLMDNVGRIAALIHLCNRDDKSTEINAATFNLALEIGKHYSKHFLTYFSAPSKIQLNAKKLHEKMFAYMEKDGPIFDTGWMARYTHLSVYEIKSAIPLLENDGYLRQVRDYHYQFYPNKTQGHHSALGGGYQRDSQHFGTPPVKKSYRGN